MKTYNQFINEGVFKNQIMKKLFEKVPNLKKFRLAKIEAWPSPEDPLSRFTYENYNYDDNFSYCICISVVENEMMVNEYVRDKLYKNPLDAIVRTLDIKDKKYNIKNKPNYDKLYNEIMHDVLKSIPHEYNQIEKFMNAPYKDEEMSKTYLKIRKEIENSREYQMYLFEKGYIKELSKVENPIPELKDKLVDIKKQTEWS